MKKILLSILFCAFVAVSVSAQTTAFTYQGSLKDGANPANGNYDLEFKLFDAVSAGTQQGSTIQRLNVAVANGIFTVSLDFGAGTLPGADRFLDIGVRTAGGGAFTALSPRQKVDSAPYSVRSLNSATADVATNATQLGGVAANQYVVTTDPRMTDSRPPTAGSSNYIQNQNAAPQSTSNFNISGTGTGNIFNAASKYEINGNRVLSVPGTNNVFAGVLAGSFNAGSDNAFFGFAAGQLNTTGGNNSFFGTSAGVSNTTGISNSFFGQAAGDSNTAGDNNTYIGQNSGSANTTGNNNAFLGKGAGTTNTTGSNNTLLGYNTEVGSGALSFATALGADAVVTSSNTVVLGRSADIVRVPGFIRVVQLGSAGSTALCQNVNDTISTCSSSVRYKTNIGQFSQGMSFVNQLRPITFNWKGGGMKDVGFGAEDIAKIDPRFVTYNSSGEVEGVKYDRISTVLVNAIKEQQQQIEKQQALIEQLEKRLEQLEKREQK